MKSEPKHSVRHKGASGAFLQRKMYFPTICSLPNTFYLIPIWMKPEPKHSVRHRGASGAFLQRKMHFPTICSLPNTFYLIPIWMKPEPKHSVRHRGASGAFLQRKMHFPTICSLPNTFYLIPIWMKSEPKHSVRHRGASGAFLQRKMHFPTICCGLSSKFSFTKLLNHPNIPAPTSFGREMYGKKTGSNNDGQAIQTSSSDWEAILYTCQEQMHKDMVMCCCWRELCGCLQVFS